MSLSREHLSYHEQPVIFDVDALAGYLKDSCPEVVFAFLMGTSADGVAAVGSDIDIALYVRGNPTFSLFQRVQDVVSKLATGVHCDAGCLNKAEPVYRYEALKGRLLFTRDEEAYLRFYSVTCREYESQMFHYVKQHQYRMQRRALRCT